MESHVKELIVFRMNRITRGQDTWAYYTGSVSGYGISNSFKTDPLEAKDFTNEPANVIVAALALIAKHTEPPGIFELVRIKISTEIEAINLDDGEIMEERRRSALAKLTSLEIEALGVQRLATYDKVKFHGS